MKGADICLSLFLFGLLSCQNSNQLVDGFITIDVTVNYPEKELILQDFMDVEYVPLETTDSFVCQGLVLDVSRNYILIRNRNSDGNLYLFDRTGKGVRVINRKGQGGEEYTFASSAVLDEENGEMFINNMATQKILVYDLSGNFKRSLSCKDYRFFTMYNFDQNNLICHDSFDNDKVPEFQSRQSFMLISKQDGSVTREIQIPFKEKKTIVMRVPIEGKKGMSYAFMPNTVYPIVPYLDSFVLDDISADTMYQYTSDHVKIPLIVRTPPVHTMLPETFLLPSLLTERYYFLEAITKEKGFPSSSLVYDRQENEIFKYKVYNSDYTNDKEADMKSKPVNREIPSCQIIEAWELVQDYKNGNLQGHLQEIAATLEEEDNPVIMLIKHSGNKK